MNENSYGGNEITEAVKSISKVTKGLLVKKAGVITAIITFVLALFIVFIGIFAVIPLGIMGDDANDIAKSEKTLKTTLQGKYNAAKTSTDLGDAILDYIRKNYEPDASANNLYKENGYYRYKSETVDITFNYRNSLDDMLSGINAYITAVNGAITFYDFSSVMISEEEKSALDGITDAFSLIKGAFRSSSLSEYFDDIALSASDCFVADTVSSRWSVNVHKTTVKKQRNTTDSSLLAVTSPYILNRIALPPIIPEPDPEPVPLPEPEPIYDDITLFTGNITINLYYDLSSFKSKELNKIIDNYTKEGDIRQDLSMSLNAYYESYFKIAGKEDNREVLFSPLLADGSLFYVPITGLSESFAFNLDGGTSGYFTVSELDNKTNTQIWNRITALRKQGVLTSLVTDHQCTAFATYWFYLVYGKSYADAGWWLKGNGNQMAKVLVTEHSDKFYLSSSPKAGSICSIGSTYSAKVNHVLCVEAVDYEKKTIIISEGNVFSKKGCSGTVNAGMRIHKQLTFAEFENYIKQLAKSMSGSSSGAWAVFANPIDDK